MLKRHGERGEFLQSSPACLGAQAATKGLPHFCCELGRWSGSLPQCCPGPSCNLWYVRAGAGLWGGGSPPDCLLFVPWTVSCLQISAHLSHAGSPSRPLHTGTAVCRPCAVPSLGAHSPGLGVLPPAALAELVTRFLSSLARFPSKPAHFSPKI